MCRIIEWIAGPGLGVGVTLLIGTLIVWFAVDQYRGERRAFRLPTTPLAHARPGPIEIAGQVVADGGVRAPASGTDAVWYQIDIEEGVDATDSDGAATVDWQRVKRLGEGVPFWLHDGTGRARIDPTAIDVRAGAADTDTWIGAIEPHAERLRELLIKHGCTTGRYSVVERRICAGARIKVAGIASYTDQADDRKSGSYRDGAKQGTLTISGTDAEPLAVGAVDIERQLARETAGGIAIGVSFLAVAAVIVATAIASC
jgi:hypothetical protein